MRSTTSACAAAWTNVTEVVRTSAPLIPVIVNGKLPDGVDTLDVIVIVDDPELVTDDGLKAAAAPDGNPLTLNATAPPNPADGDTVTV